MITLFLLHLLICNLQENITNLSGLSNILSPKHLHTTFFGNINLNAMFSVELMTVHNPVSKYLI